LPERSQEDIKLPPWKLRRGFGSWGSYFL